jgi:hypothetical protein
MSIIIGRDEGVNLFFNRSRSFEPGFVFSWKQAI